MFNSLLVGLAKIANKVLVKSKLLPEDPVASLNIKSGIPTFYISRLKSRSDLIALRTTCLNLGLPDPSKQEMLGEQPISRYIPLNQRSPLFAKNKKLPSPALAQGEAIFQAIEQYDIKHIQVIPVTILWGRDPGKEKAGIATLLTSSVTPSWLRKLLVLFVSGRDNFIRFSHPVDLEQLKKHHTKGGLSHKLIRVARVHFKRQKLAATGPKLPTRDQLFQSLLASESVKKAIDDKVKNEGIPKQQAKQEALALLDEIAADYRESMIRVGERVLTWFWNKLYNGIEVKNAERVHELTQKGHEIIYMPCHRSHMDYLLLTYVIYHQGLVPPHIAAGINLNFWPAGPIFRRSGAFFIRRSFKGNKLYSAVFREYLSQLFIKGYSVKFYTEGGRSRTGRLLPPKTGMLGMTLQAMLRGIERPISIVPVYIGYEHVMEVNTYLKELAGSHKQKESVLGVFKTLKKLKNYGKGNVNFGEPININQFLNQHQPQWRDDISPNEVQKPQWLSPSVNQLADQVMQSINNNAALNAVTLMSLSLLVTDKLAMPKSELISQLNCLLSLAQQAPYHASVSLPEKSAEQLVAHALTLDKFEVCHDQFGDIIKIADKESVLLNYYRNNIIHLFVVPSLLALLIIRKRKVAITTCKEHIKALYPLLQQEWYMIDLSNDYIDKVLASFATQQLVTINEEAVSLASNPAAIFNMELLAKTIECTLLRYSSVVALILNSKGTSRADLEAHCHIIANRLGVLHGIVTPEFFDKKVMSNLISSLRDAQHLTHNDDNQIIANQSLSELQKIIQGLLSAPLSQSVVHTISQKID